MQYSSVQHTSQSLSLSCLSLTGSKGTFFKKLVFSPLNYRLIYLQIHLVSNTPKMLANGDQQLIVINDKNVSLPSHFIK